MKAECREKIWWKERGQSAAKRLTELTGKEAKTIHRLLEVDYSSDEMHPVFRKNEKNPLKAPQTR